MPVRITIPHNKDKQQLMRDVDAAFDRLIQTKLPGTIQISNFERNWSGSMARFHCTAQVGPFQSPIRGYVDVTDHDVTIDCDLPLLLTKIVSEKAIQSGVESTVRGLLK